MIFWTNFEAICKSRKTTPTAVVRKTLGLSGSKVTAWKNGALPKEEVIEQLAEVGNTAALSAQQITLMFAAAGLSTSVKATYGDIANDKRAQMAFAAREFQEGDNLQSYLLRVTKENLEKAQK